MAAQIWIDLYNGKFWSTKIVECFSRKALNLIFNLNFETHHSYDHLKEALLLRFSYTPENLRKRFCDALPEKKKKKKILDSVDKLVYRHIIEQKPPSLDSLIKLAVNFCETHPGTKFSKQPSSSTAETACALSNTNSASQLFTTQQSNADTPQGKKKQEEKTKFTTNQHACQNSNNNFQSQPSISQQSTQPQPTNQQFQNYRQHPPFFQYKNNKGPHFQYYNRGRPWPFNPNWGYRGGYNNNYNRFNNPQNEQFNNPELNNSLNQPFNNYRRNNFRGNYRGNF